MFGLDSGRGPGRWRQPLVALDARLRFSLDLVKNGVSPQDVLPINARPCIGLDSTRGLLNRCETLLWSRPCVSSNTGVRHGRWSFSSAISGTDDNISYR